jgi:hypothetical protein
VVAVPSALGLRQWARAQIAASSAALPQVDAHGAPVERMVLPSDRSELAPGDPAPGCLAPGYPTTPGYPPAQGYPPAHGYPPVWGNASGEPTAGGPLAPPAAPRHPTAVLPAGYAPGTFAPSSGVPTDSPTLRPGGTLPGVGRTKLMPTQVIRVGPQGRTKPVVIAGVAVTLVALGVIVISAVTSPGGDTPTRATATEVADNAAEVAVATGGQPGELSRDGDAKVAEAPDESAPAAPPITEFAARLHVAIGSAAAAELALLFDAHAFAFGVDGNDLAEGRDGVVAQLREDLGQAGSVAIKFSHDGQDSEVGWLAEELRVGNKTFVITAALRLANGAWTIAALHWAEAMPNATAHRLARDGELAVPDAIPNTNDSSPLADAMRTAFASIPSFVDARSARADAFNFGSAPGERLKGGSAIKKVFSRIPATIRLHDAVKVGSIGERGGWGVANVDFTETTRDGAQLTQTFRVLAVWIKEEAGWRIVQTQWSNAR